MKLKKSGRKKMIKQLLKKNKDADKEITLFNTVLEETRIQNFTYIRETESTDCLPK